MKPYYADDLVTLYLGDCREVTNWLAGTALVTDPPYGIKWRGSYLGTPTPKAHIEGVVGDADTSVRDAALSAWGPRLPALVFGSLRAPYPDGWKRMLVFHKPVVACGPYGNMPWISNWEPVFALGEWPKQVPAHDAVIRTSAKAAGGYSGYSTRYGHPHAKPIDVMETLIAACPPGVIADPFAGSGSTLVAARNLGRKAIGVEIDERYAERAAKRLCQDVLISGDLAAL